MKTTDDFKCSSCGEHVIFENALQSEVVDGMAKLFCKCSFCGLITPADISGRYGLNDDEISYRGAYALLLVFLALFAVLIARGTTFAFAVPVGEPYNTLLNVVSVVAVVFVLLFVITAVSHISSHGGLYWYLQGGKKRQ